MSGSYQKPLNCSLEVGELYAVKHLSRADWGGKSTSHAIFPYTYTKNLSSLHLKIKFHWAFCMLSGDPTWSRNPIMWLSCYTVSVTCLCNANNPYFLKNFKTRKDLVPTLPPASFQASVLFAPSTPNAAQLSSASKTPSSRLWVFFARLPSPTASPTHTGGWRHQLHVNHNSSGELRVKGGWKISRASRVKHPA